MRAGREASDKLWYVGKSVARQGACDDPAQSVLAQKRLVLEHSKLLVEELRLATAPLTMWFAPPDSEMQVAQRMLSLQPLDGMPRPTLSQDDSGFEPEQWLDPAQGFYVRLTNEGAPISGPTPAKVVTAEQLEEMQRSGVEQCRRAIVRGQQ